MAELPSVPGIPSHPQTKREPCFKNPGCSALSQAGRSPTSLCTPSPRSRCSLLGLEGGPSPSSLRPHRAGGRGRAWFLPRGVRALTTSAAGHTLTHLDLRLLHVVQQFTCPNGSAGPGGVTLRTSHSPRADVPTPLPAPRLGRGELGEQALPFLRAPQSSRADTRGAVSQ